MVFILSCLIDILLILWAFFDNKPMTDINTPKNDNVPLSISPINSDADNQSEGRCWRLSFEEIQYIG
jgi:hypothetical protein